ncbi:MAG: GNAT family N-acetyltransferase [Candidatus Bathyarchaeota archaeon]|nr:MAG: GNAT family N-acetyltransferase [Candidatus Bathyarchaeota archaeon]
MICRSLQPEDFEALYSTFIEAFSDYQIKIQMTKERFNAINIRRGLNYELSVGAFDDNKMVGFTLNGIDLWEDKLTAYDMCTGVIPEHRGKGIGNSMFAFLLPKLRMAGVKQYLLEVLRSNEAAHKLYTRKGFRETRKLECLKITSSKLSAKTITRQDTAIRQIEKPDWSRFETFWDWNPSWQNSIDSMKRCPEEKMVYGVFHGDELRAYGILYPESGDIPQIAVDKDFRRRGIGSLLLKEFAERAGAAGKLSIVNIDSSSKETLSFFESIGFENFAGQYEMMLDL